MSLYTGLIWISQDISVPFSFENNILMLHFKNMMCPIDGEVQDLYGDSYSEANGILFHLTFPISTILKRIRFYGTEPFLTGEVSLNVDYYITNFKSDCKYENMVFRFEELNWFAPSICNCAFNRTEGEYTFLKRVTELSKFDFDYNGKKIEFLLRAQSDISYSAKCNASTFTELVLGFERTDDINFIIGLYILIKNAFSFICNRRNIDIKETILQGKVVELLPTKNDPQQFEEKEVESEQWLYIIDDYQEDLESQKEIQRTINYGLVASHFRELIELIGDNKVSIFSIHSCNKVKNLIDLDQSLHITAAFEYYQRTFLPEIASDVSIEFYNDIKDLVENYAEKQTGNKRKKAKELIKHLVPHISLKEKIVKVYSGYSTWNGLAEILNKWFSNKVSDLAQVANDWRNELAHEKNEYQIVRKVVDAIRLVEHINYCIVLRQAKYNDEEIKDIIEEILKHS